jgi:predicted metalloprotease
MTVTPANTSNGSGPMHDLSRRFANLAVAFAAQLRQINEDDVRIDVLRTVPTAEGFVTERESCAVRMNRRSYFRPYRMFVRVRNRRIETRPRCSSPRRIRSRH